MIIEAMDMSSVGSMPLPIKKQVYKGTKVDPITHYQLLMTEVQPIGGLERTMVDIFGNKAWSTK